jgi:RNA polymerase sigma-70 factor, ECF subfamily
VHNPEASADFDTFYRATAPRTLQYAYAICGDMATAQDLTSEAYIRAWQRWRIVGGYEAGDAWIRRVVTRLANDRWRHLRVRRRHESATPPPATLAPPTEDLIVLVAALRDLPVRQREALVLHYVVDRSVAEIAAETGPAEGTVKSWLSRGRAALAAALEPSEKELNHAG